MRLCLAPRQIKAAAILCSSSVLFAAAETETNKEEFVKGAALVGGTNGMYFDSDGFLYVAQVMGRAISKVDPESGSVLETFTGSNILFPDDLTIAPDGTLYWTDVLGGTVGRISRTDAEPELLYDFGTYPNANPVTLSDDGTRLFFAQCFYEGPEGNGLYQLNLATGVTSTIVEGVPGCASNAMDYRHGALHTPRLFEGRVVRVDLQEEDDNNQDPTDTTLPATPKTAQHTTSYAISDVTTNVNIPVALKFNSKGVLHVLDAGNGQVLEVDIEDKDITSNTKVVAQLPFTGLDNLAFDADDRLYVSSWSTGYVMEVLGKDKFRVVSPGSFSSTSGLAIIDDVLYAGGPLELHGYDTDTAEEVLRVEALLGISDLIFPLALAATKEGHLAAVSFFGNVITMWDVKANKSLYHAEFAAPTDAHPFGDGMIVSEAVTGNIIQASGPELADRTVIANLPGCFFLSGNDQDVYVSNSMEGTVLQIISNGSVLDTPIQVSSGHASPEGIALDGKDLLVVSVGDGALEKVNLETGEVTVLADGLGFLSALPELGMAFGFSNDVVVHDGYAYVNADGDNLIYKVSLTPSGVNAGRRGMTGVLKCVSALVVLLLLA